MFREWDSCNSIIGLFVDININSCLGKGDNMIATETASEAPANLAVTHMDLAQRIATRLYRWYSWVCIDDLKSYAYLGLALAAKTYKPDRGVPFVNFASQKAMYLAIDEMRKNGILHRRRANPGPTIGALVPDIPDPGATNQLQLIEKRDLCYALLRKLREQDRHLLMMYYSDQLTFKEIARVFKISESAVCLRHKALIGKLRKLADTLKMV